MNHFYFGEISHPINELDDFKNLNELLNIKIIFLINIKFIDTKNQR